MKRLPLIAAILGLAGFGVLHAADPAPATTSPAEEPGTMVTADGGVVTMWHADGRGIQVSADQAADVYIHYLEKIVALTKDQKQTITDLFAVRTEAIDDFNKTDGEKLQAAGKVLSDAYNTPNPDQDAIIKARDNYEKAYAPLRKIIKDSSDLLDRVLTREQKRLVWDAQALYYIARMTKPITLGASQIRELQAVFRDVKEEVPGAENLYQAVDRVLTPEQKVTILKDRSLEFVKQNFAGANLTADQLEKVAHICETAARNQDAPDINNFWMLMNDIQPQVMALLTDDQKEALKHPAPLRIAPAAPRGK